MKRKKERKERKKERKKEEIPYKKTKHKNDRKENERIKEKRLHFCGLKMKVPFRFPLAVNVVRK